MVLGKVRCLAQKFEKEGGNGRGDTKLVDERRKSPNSESKSNNNLLKPKWSS